MAAMSPLRPAAAAARAFSSQCSCHGFMRSAAANDGATILEQMEVENQVCGWVIIHKGGSERSGMSFVIRSRWRLRTRCVALLISKLQLAELSSAGRLRRHHCRRRTAAPN